MFRDIRISQIVRLRLSLTRSDFLTTVILEKAFNKCTRPSKSTEHVKERSSSHQKLSIRNYQGVLRDRREVCAALFESDKPFVCGSCHVSAFVALSFVIKAGWYLSPVVDGVSWYWLLVASIASGNGLFKLLSLTCVSGMVRELVVTYLGVEAILHPFLLHFSHQLTVIAGH